MEFKKLGTRESITLSFLADRQIWTVTVVPLQGLLTVTESRNTWAYRWGSGGLSAYASFLEALADFDADYIVAKLARQDETHWYDPDRTAENLEESLRTAGREDLVHKATRLALRCNSYEEFLTSVPEDLEKAAAPIADKLCRKYKHDYFVMRFHVVPALIAYMKGLAT